MSDIAVVEVTALTGITAVEVAPVAPITLEVVTTRVDVTAVTPPTIAVDVTGTGVEVVSETSFPTISVIEVAPVGPIFVDVVIGTSIEVIETETVLAPAAVDVLIPGLRGPKGDKGEQGDPGDGTSMVLSVNGRVGDVVLDAEDVQADPEGAALAAASASMAMHLADPDPHGQYLVDGDILDAGNF